MSSFFKKLIPKNIAGMLGLIQTAIPIIRELLMVITRLCAVVIPGEKDDEIIEKIRDAFDTFEEYYERIKNFFL